MLRRLVDWSALRARGDRFESDSATSRADLLSILFARASAAVRGVWHRLWLRDSRGVLFVGKGVTLRHRRSLSVGRGVVVDDYACIEALSLHGITLGDGVTIDRYATLRVTGTLRQLGEGLTIGPRSSVGAYSFIGAAGGVRIGQNVLVGQRVGIHAENHQYLDSQVPIRNQQVVRSGIVIEDDCWLGSGCTILDGVTVGRGSVVAAGAVVSQDVEPFSVVAGVPARLVRCRRATPLSDEPRA